MSKNLTVKYKAMAIGKGFNFVLKFDLLVIIPLSISEPGILQKNIFKDNILLQHLRWNSNQSINPKIPTYGE
jgi:hypothetical protein